MWPKCPGSVLISWQLVLGTGHDCREVSWVYRSSASSLLPNSMASVETLLRRRYECKNDGPPEEQSGHPCVEQVQCCQKHHCWVQAAVWTHCSRILPQSVFTLWPCVLRNSLIVLTLVCFCHIHCNVQPFIRALRYFELLLRDRHAIMLPVHSGVKG